MKTIFGIVICLCSLTSAFAQESNKAASTVPGAGNGNCNCKPTQSVCYAEAFFMTCCTCCQAGMSCGSWTAFGLAGCGCANAAKGDVKPEIRLFVNRLDDFLSYLEQNRVPNDNLVSLTGAAKANHKSVAGKTPDADYINLENAELQQFTDGYLAEIRGLVNDSKYGDVINEYFKTHK